MWPVRSPPASRCRRPTERAEARAGSSQLAARIVQAPPADRRPQQPGRADTPSPSSWSPRRGPGSRERPRPAGAAARRRNARPRVTGTIRPDPGSRWSARRPPTRPWAVPAGRRRRPRTNDLMAMQWAVDAGGSLCVASRRLSGRVVFPPGEGIGRTWPGAGSRPRRGRFRPPDRHRRAIRRGNS
jgi:hypothetical protein